MIHQGVHIVVADVCQGNDWQCREDAQNLVLYVWAGQIWVGQPGDAGQLPLQGCQNDQHHSERGESQGQEQADGTRPCKRL